MQIFMIVHMVVIVLEYIVAELLLIRSVWIVMN